MLTREDQERLARKESEEPWVKDARLAIDQVTCSFGLRKKERELFEYVANEGLLDRGTLITESMARAAVWPERDNHHPDEHSVIRTTKAAMASKVNRHMWPPDAAMKIVFDRGSWAPRFVDCCSAVLIPTFRNENEAGDDDHICSVIWRESLRLLGQCPGLRASASEGHSNGGGIYRIEGRFMTIGGASRIDVLIRDLKRRSIVAAGNWESQRHDHLVLAQDIERFVAGHLAFQPLAAFDAC
jgi:hypothetical protein